MLDLSDETPSKSDFPIPGELRNGLGTLSKVIASHYADDNQYSFSSKIRICQNDPYEGILQSFGADLRDAGHGIWPETSINSSWGLGKIKSSVLAHWEHS